MNKIDNKNLIGWALMIILSVFSSSAVSSYSKSEKQENEAKLNATQQIEINTLKRDYKAVDDLVKEIKSNVDDTHDNLLILMTKNGLTPVRRQKMKL